MEEQLQHPVGKDQSLKRQWVPFPPRTPYHILLQFSILKYTIYTHTHTYIEIYYILNIYILNIRYTIYIYIHDIFSISYHILLPWTRRQNHLENTQYRR